MKHSIVAFIVACLPTVASAQVGHLPGESPFRDLNFRQEATGFVGYFSAPDDPAGVAYRSGPLIGARYEVRIGGPAQFTARVATVFSERRVIDPTESADTRFVRMESAPLHLADIGISVNLTGQKSWHGFVPIVHGGLGIASDLETERDSGGYGFGTTFALAFGTGVRWLPADRWQLRADFADYLYQVSYPDTYYQDPVGGGDPVLPAGQSKSFWTNNLTLTLGVSYHLFR
ncbi:MAG: hypothetical protein ACRENI_15130 [Gemmatimonadaceae bacterium]